MLKYTGFGGGPTYLTSWLVYSILWYSLNYICSSFTNHVSWKRIVSYICYPGTFPNTHFLNHMNMIVIAYYVHACYPIWLSWYTFDDCLIIFDKMHVVWCISILTFMFYDSALRSRPSMHPNSLLWQFDHIRHVIFLKSSSLLRYP